MNTFTLKFFAKLREDIGEDELIIPCDQVANTSEISAYLVNHNPTWRPFLERKFLCAVNQQMVTGEYTINDGDEVALFPPVTGG